MERLRCWLTCHNRTVASTDAVRRNPLGDHAKSTTSALCPEYSRNCRNLILLHRVSVLLGSSLCCVNFEFPLIDGMGVDMTFGVVIVSMVDAV